MSKPYPDDAVPSLYDEHASWFHLLTAPADYREETEWVLTQMRARLDRDPRSILELGSGGGNLASHFPESIEIVLTDLSAKMLELSRTINPDREHLVGDMRTFQLGRTVECVLVHDAIVYMLTEADLRQTIANARGHLEVGGVLILQPDEVAETFEAVTGHGGHDDGDRGLRYLEWSWDPDPADTTYEVAYACILREGNQTRTVQDRHRCGLFPRDTWLRLMNEEGFATEVVVDPWKRDVFIGVATEPSPTPAD